MHFLSFDWIGWLAATVAAYWLLPAGWRDRFLIVISLIFLAIYSPVSAAILVFFSVFVYFSTLGSNVSGYRVLIVGGIIVGVVTFFKIRLGDAPVDVVADYAIPLGLSYYSFRCLHYIFERYKDTVKPANFEEFIAYLYFIPTMVVGPIHRAGQFLHDYRTKRWDAAMLSEGIERILYGYVKIAVLGNYFVMTRFGYFIGSLDQENVALIWYLEIVRQGINLYLQFSGFSDIAIGFARLLGYRVMENFNWPFLSKNIAEFWRRWHISLTSFSREYVYMTMLGLFRRPTVATIASMTVIGLWHDVSLPYFLWAMYHAAGIIVFATTYRLQRKYKVPKVENPYLRWPLDVLKILVTVNFFWFGFVIVAQPDLASAMEVYYVILFSWWL